MTDEYLFNSSHAALTFAYNFVGQNYNAPPMNKMLNGTLGTGKGLVGLDGAGQSGMIRAEIAQFDQPMQMVIAARFAPRKVECTCRRPCCSGKIPGAEWKGSIDFLTEHVLRQVLSGCVSHYRLRRGIVLRLYGEKASLVDLAEASGLHRITVGEQNGKISKYLLGLEAKAARALDDRFKMLGLIPA